MIVDVHLPDGSGFDVAERARKAHSGTSILVVTGEECSPEVSHRAYRLRAELLLKPCPPDLLEQFVERAFAAPEDRRRWLLERFDAICVSAGVSPREREVLALHVRGARRREIERSLGVSAATVKTLVARLLRKTGCKTLSQLAALVWMDAALQDGGATA